MRAVLTPEGAFKIVTRNETPQTLKHLLWLVTSIDALTEQR